MCASRLPLFAMFQFSLIHALHAWRSQMILARQKYSQSVTRQTIQWDFPISLWRSGRSESNRWLGRKEICVEWITWVLSEAIDSNSHDLTSIPDVILGRDDSFTSSFWSSAHFREHISFWNAFRIFVACDIRLFSPRCDFPARSRSSQNMSRLVDRWQRVKASMIFPLTSDRAMVKSACCVAESTSE